MSSRCMMRMMALDYMDTAEAVRIADADSVVSLGGDGTMLRIARAGGAE